jgi:hypothetical protein
MVVIRIKENEYKQIPKKINDDDIKIMKNLKLCKLISSEIDEKIEKKIEFIISSKPGNNIEYDGTKDEYTIFGLQQRCGESGRWNCDRTPHKFTPQRANRHSRSQFDAPREFSSRKKSFSRWERN